MPPEQEVKEVIPSASRLVESLRSVGYSFQTAVADLVDNSIEAAATEISIKVTFSGKNSYVMIHDNGKGMTQDCLIEAMRFGTERGYGSSDLGKFGLGLKTASLSQCRKFTVASRSSSEDKNVSLVAWDLDHIQNTNKWEIIYPSEDDTYSKFCCSTLGKNSGTVVLWWQLQQLLDDYSDPDSKHAKNGLLSLVVELERYLAMVFHRFIDSHYRENPIKIILNGNLVKPWNPFALKQKATQKLSPVTIQAGIRNAPIIFEPFILPRRDQFASIDEADDYAGPKGWDSQQGFYIYRADRMIQSGGWCGLRRRDEHLKLARIALHFPTELDHLFNIDVSKMTVTIPGSLQDKIKDFLKPVSKVANDTYRKKYPSPPSPPSPQPHPVGKKYTAEQVRKILSTFADEDEWPTVESVFDRAFGIGKD